MVVAAALPEVAVVPDVLADADAEPRAGHVEHLRALERLEVAVLVEDVVGGQQRLAEALLHASAPQQRRAVVERATLVGRIGFRQPHQHRRTVGEFAGQRIQLRPAPGHEGFRQQEVAGQVADEGKLGRHGQVGTLRPRLLRGGGNQRRVAGDVADGRIDLQ